MSFKICFFVFFNLVLIIAVQCRPDPGRTLRNRYRYLEDPRETRRNQRTTTVDDDETQYYYDKGILREVPRNKSNVVRLREELTPMKPIHLANTPEDVEETRHIEIGEMNHMNHQRHNHKKQYHDIHFDDTIYEREEVRILFKKKVARDPNFDITQSDIVFPDQIPDELPIIKERKFVPQRTSDCYKTFCVKDQHYPSKTINEAIANKFGNFSDFLTSDVHGPINITQRIDASDERPLCASKEDFIFPQSGKTKDEEWLFIINNERYRQSVRAEICREPNQDCELAKHFPSGYEAKCKQKYIYRKLHALNPNGAVIQDDFKMPSCCTCYYKNTLSPLSFVGRSSPARRRK